MLHALLHNDEGWGLRIPSCERKGSAMIATGNMASQQPEVSSSHPVCGRCGGFMASEWVNGRHGAMECRRCVICGDRVDPVILANRQDFLSTSHDRCISAPRDVRWLRQRRVIIRSGRTG